MSFAQGAPTQDLSIVSSNVFLYGSSTAGNAFTVQQLSAGNVASFQRSTGATSLIINPSGQVGIGKTNPGYALDVTGDLNFTGTFRQNGTPYVGSQWTGTSTLFFVGNVGIGTASPQYRLHVTNPGPLSNIVVETDTNAIGQRSEIRFGIPAFSGTGKRAGITSNTYVSDGSDLQFWTNASGGTLSTPRMTILQSGFVGIGTTNPTYKLHVAEGDSSFAYFGPNATWGSALKVGAGNSFSAAGIASVVVSNGNLHIDCANGAFQMYLNYFQGGGAGGVNATVGCYGAFLATGDITAFYSDERLKTKVGRIENALDKVCSLSAFKYVHNDIAKQNGFDGDDVQVGLSAQEVQKVLPEVVARAPFDMGTEYDVGLGKSKSGQDYLTLKYERIVPLLVEALKEERSERLRLQDRLERLEILLSQDRTP